MEKTTIDDNFIVPAVSVMDRRNGNWKSRKKKWRETMGSCYQTREGVLFDSLEMRMPKLYQDSKADRERLGVTFEQYIKNHVTPEVMEKYQEHYNFGGASAFDPVLAEICLKWFTPGENSRVFNCFAGGITIGTVACKLGHTFTGIEIRQEQVDADIEQSGKLDINPTYICDDGRNVRRHLGTASQDLFITCPPYYDLEVYSDLDDDASNQKSYEEFIGILSTAFKESILALKKNRFAVVVVSDIRDENGVYRDFPGDVIRIFKEAGCHLWNDIIMFGDTVNSFLHKKYMHSRKVVKIHQRVLVFYNGNPRHLTKYFPRLK